MDPGCGKAMDPDMILSTSLGSHDTMTLGGSIGHSDWYGFGRGSFLGPYHSHKWRPRTRTSLWTLVATQAVDTNTVPDCCKTMNTGMVLGSRLGLNVTMALDYNIGLLYQNHPAAGWS